MVAGLPPNLKNVGEPTTGGVKLSLVPLWYTSSPLPINVPSDLLNSSFTSSIANVDVVSPKPAFKLKLLIEAPKNVCWGNPSEPSFHPASDRDPFLP